MNILEKIDSFLLGKVFQKLSDGFQMITGLNCFFLAKTFAFASWAMLLISLLAVTSVTPIQRILLILGSLVCLIALWILINMWDKKDREISAKEGVKNPTAYYGFLVRVMPLLKFLSDFILVSAEAMQRPYWWHLRLAYLLLTMALYFSACTPLPPAKKRCGEAANFSFQEI